MHLMPEILWAPWRMKYIERPTTGKETGDIFIDLPAANDDRANLILREGQGALAFHPQPLRSAALVVLKAPDVPSALFEAGFITNEEEAGRLASPEGQQQFAKVLGRAIRIYFARQARP